MKNDTRTLAAVTLAALVFVLLLLCLSLVHDMSDRLDAHETTHLEKCSHEELIDTLRKVR